MSVRAILWGTLKDFLPENFIKRQLYLLIPSRRRSCLQTTQWGEIDVNESLISHSELVDIRFLHKQHRIHSGKMRMLHWNIPLWKKKVCMKSACEWIHSVNVRRPPDDGLRLNEIWDERNGVWVAGVGEDANRRQWRINGTLNKRTHWQMPANAIN